MKDKIQKIREEVAGIQLYAQSEVLKQILDYIDKVQEEPVSIDFEQELYKAFGQVKDFTLGMRIAKWFYDMGKNNQEPLSEDLEEASKEWLSPQLDKSYAAYGETKQMELTHFDGYAMLNAIEFGAQWQKTKDESTPEDLGEYINELSKQFPEVSFAKLSRIAVRVAKWQKEQFEKNRLAHCDAQTEEEAEIELDFVMSIIEKEHRQPTFDDAIKYGMNLQKEQMMAKAKGGTVQKDYQIIMDDGTYIDLDPSMSLKPSLAVKEGERIKVIVINED